MLEAKSCGAETVPELVTSPQTTLPVDTPPLVAVRCSPGSRSPVEAAQPWLKRPPSGGAGLDRQLEMSS